MSVARMLIMAGPSAPTDPLVRQKANTQSTGTTNTVTFTETPALDSTHLLVALVCCYSSWTNPGGWTQVATGTYGILEQRILTKQGDGSTNSITVTQTSNTSSTVQLLAFAGYVTTAISATGGGTNNVNTGGNVTLTGPSTTPAVSGVCIMFIAAQGVMGVTRTMSNGFTEVAVPTAPFLSLSGRKTYTGTGTYSSLVDWASSVSYFRWFSVVIQLA